MCAASASPSSSWMCPVPLSSFMSTRGLKPSPSRRSAARPRRSSSASTPSAGNAPCRAARITARSRGPRGAGEGGGPGQFLTQEGDAVRRALREGPGCSRSLDAARRRRIAFRRRLPRRRHRTAHRPIQAGFGLALGQVDQAGALLYAGRDACCASATGAPAAWLPHPAQRRGSSEPSTYGHAAITSAASDTTITPKTISAIPARHPRGSASVVRPRSNTAISGLVQ